MKYLLGSPKFAQNFGYFRPLDRPKSWVMWWYLEEARTSTSATLKVVYLFGYLLNRGKMRVNGRPRSFGPARFSLSMSLKKTPTMGRNHLITDIAILIKDVHANCFCASLLGTKIHTSRHAWARALTNKMNHGRADGHCYSFFWI